jgi:hypothetical protein
MSQPAVPQKLLVVSFDDPLRAQEFLLAAARLQKQDDLQVHDAVFVRRDADGSRLGAVPDPRRAPDRRRPRFRAALS